MKDITPSQILESVRENLPDPGPPISKDEHEKWYFNYISDTLEQPLHAQKVYRRLVFLRRCYFYQLDHEWRRIHDLSPSLFKNKLSKKDKILQEDILIEVDQAIFNYVAIDKEIIINHTLIKARIISAQHYRDDVFFCGLGKAISKKTSGHKASRTDIRIMAAELLGAGKGWTEVYDDLCEAQMWGEEPVQPDTFHKFLKRNQLI